jgi:choline dehydrogenase-like flavoprotein
VETTLGGWVTFNRHEVYVLSSAIFPTCPGINPTLPLWPLCYRAAERLVGRFKRGEGC